MTLTPVETIASCRSSSIVPIPDDVAIIVDMHDGTFTGDIHADGPKLVIPSHDRDPIPQIPDNGVFPESVRRQYFTVLDGGDVPLSYHLNPHSLDITQALTLMDRTDPDYSSETRVTATHYGVTDSIDAVVEHLQPRGEVYFTLKLLQADGARPHKHGGIIPESRNPEGTVVTSTGVECYIFFSTTPIVTVSDGTAHIRGYGADAYRVTPAVAEYAGFTA